MAEGFDRDFIVIGGGSGGLAAAKEAKRCGAEKVTCFDYVTPTVHGSKWGLGGTCVNVGCVPKKIFHYASHMGHYLLHDGPHSGWKVDVAGHEWKKLVETVQSQVKRLNFSYRTGLRGAGVEYINAFAKLEGPNAVSYEKNGQKQTLTARHILVAVGGRPVVPADVPGARELAITSDDLFSLDRPPKNTLIVGASYIALECAGFLTQFGRVTGHKTTVAVRSILLRGFDRQCAEKIGVAMKEEGTIFKHSLPAKIDKLPSGRLTVVFQDGSTGEYDTVMYAVGRRASTDALNLAAAGVKTNEHGKIICVDEQSVSAPTIFCVGDALAGGIELTPVAIKAGELLARRLFAKAQQKMNYNLIATTIFTPVEYGCVGFSEDAAEEKFGKENIETFLFEFTTLEIAAMHREKVPEVRADEYDVDASPNSLVKLVCRKDQNLRVIGAHFVGANAGEVTQGYALALRLGATKKDFDDTVGIHPTDAEAFHSLSVTRASGESFVAAGGCGGGKCG